MSSEKVELVGRVYEAFNARDIEALVALADPDLEWHSTFATIGGAVYHGHDGLRKWHRDLEEAWAGGIRLETEAMFDLDDQVLSYAVMYARGLGSGAEASLPITQVWRFKAGRVAYLKTYIERDEALRDLGVSEDALQPVPP